MTTMQEIKWPDIKAGAAVAGVDPHELRRRLASPPRASAKALPIHLSDKDAWVDAVADFIAALPMDLNAELLAIYLYDRFVKFPPKP